MGKSELTKEGRELVERAERSTVFIPRKKRPRPSREEMQIREYIMEYQPVMSVGEVSKLVSKKMGKVVTTGRINSVRMRMEEEARDEFRSLTSFEVAVESREQYQKMAREGWRLILEADLEEDPKTKSEIKLRGLEFIRKAREAEDRLYKLCGLHKEEIIIGYANIMQSQEWKKFQSSILMIIRYVYKQDPQLFIDAIQGIAEDPNYLDQFISYTVKRKTAIKHGDWFPPSAEGTIVDTEYTEKEEEDE